jgi:hypothetical protein
LTSFGNDARKLWFESVLGESWIQSLKTHASIAVPTNVLEFGFPRDLPILITSLIHLFMNLLPCCQWRKRAGLLTGLLLLLVSAGSAQVPKHDFLERGPLSFTGMRGINYQVLAQRDRDGCIFEKVRWTASSGRFLYRINNGSIVEGVLKDFSLEGEISIAQSGCTPFLEIPNNKLLFTATLRKPLTVAAYGGSISLASKEDVLISNIGTLNITGPDKINQTGLLSIRTSNKLTWTNANFEFPRLPEPFKLNLVSETSSSLDKEYQISLGNGVLEIDHANFAYRLDPREARTRRNLVTADYSAEVTQLGFRDFLVSLKREGLGLLIRDLTCDGDLTAKVTKTKKVPFFFNGQASVDRLTGRAAPLPDKARIEDLSVAGLRLNPRSFQRTAASAKNEIPVSGARNNFSNAFSAPAGFPPPAGPSGEPSSFQTSLQLADLYSASPVQIAAMKKLAIQSLTDHQKAAIAESRQGLNSLSDPNFAVNYPIPDIRPLLEAALTKFGINVLDASFDRQQFLFAANFPLGNNGLGQPADLKFVFRLVPSLFKKESGEQVLILRYKVSLARADQTTIAGPLSPDAIIDNVLSQIEGAEKVFGDPKPIEITIPTNLSKTFALDRVFEEPGRSKVRVRSKETELNFTLAVVLLLDDKGIHLLGQVEVQ